MSAETVTGIGIDIIEVGRLERALRRRPALALRLFPPAERAYCERMRHSAMHYAARFAAKEAVAKALGRPLRWQEVEIKRAPSGQPSVQFAGQARQLTRGARVLVSMSHTDSYAVAVALALAPPQHTD